MAAPIENLKFALLFIRHYSTNRFSLIFDLILTRFSNHWKYKNSQIFHPPRLAIPQKSVTLTAPRPLHTPALDYAFGERPVFSPIPSQLLLTFRSPRNIAAVAIGTAAAAGIAWYFLKRPRLTPEEVERNRRNLLANIGRITDGSITDMSTNQDTLTTQDILTSEEKSSRIPQIIIYNYRIAGVSYECGQVVTALPDHVRGIRIDLPIQVRYNPQNPADSIVVAESWSGLRLDSSTPYEDDADVEQAHQQPPNLPA